MGLLVDCCVGCVRSRDRNLETKIETVKKTLRHVPGSNRCEITSMDFKSIALTTRPTCQFDEYGSQKEIYKNNTLSDTSCFPTPTASNMIENAALTGRKREDCGRGVRRAALVVGFQPTLVDL